MQSIFSGSLKEFANQSKKRVPLQPFKERAYNPQLCENNNTYPPAYEEAFPNCHDVDAQYQRYSTTKDPTPFS